jgi:hypothetical protein
MRFETEKNQVNCIRVIDDENGNKTQTIIATFDAHLDHVAPHIMALLPAEEQQQLMRWLKDRNELRDQSIKQLILYALPGLLEEAGNAFDKLPTISAELHKKISTAIESFNDTMAANKNSISDNEFNPELKHMKSYDAMREIMEILKKNN